MAQFLLLSAAVTWLTAVRAELGMTQHVNILSNTIYWELTNGGMLEGD
jgi:hypothetical protein